MQYYYYIEQCQLKFIFTSILKDLFYCSSHTTMSRLPYLLYKIIIFILLIKFIERNILANIIISLIHTYVNIGEKERQRITTLAFFK